MFLYVSRKKNALQVITTILSLIVIVVVCSLSFSSS